MMLDPQLPPLILVTGACGGIGKAIVQAVAAAGYAVLALDITDGGEDFSANHFGEMVEYRQLSVTDRASVVDLCEELSRSPRLVHGLVNAAGLLETGPVSLLSDSQWKRVFDVNTHGVFLMSQAVLSAMVFQRGNDRDNSRSIVTISSNAGTVPRKGMAAYGASKAAATHFTRSLGMEAAAHGVRCNVVAPGTTRTQMVDAMWAGEDRTAEVVAGSVKEFKAGVPLGRIAEPADIAGIVAFLMGPQARHITIQEIVVDGGASQR